MTAGPAVRLAHLSDLHLALPVRSGQWNLRRLLGRWNWLLLRGRRHDPRRLDAAVATLLASPPDAVVVTGDLGQLGLPQEIALARDRLAPLPAAGIPVLLVDGNHDLYGRDEAAARAWRDAREALCAGCAPDEDGAVRVKDLELLLIDQACIRPPLVSGGRLGRERLERLARRLAGPPPLGGRVVAGHYPLRTPHGLALPGSVGLEEADAFEPLLAGASAYLCGHIHIAYSLALPSGCVQHCAGSVTGRGRLRIYEAGPDGAREAG